MPGGCSSFGFGYGKLLKLDNKISLDEELEIIMNDSGPIPESTYNLGGKSKSDLTSFFDQNTQFIMYEGQATFGNCDKALWIISNDLAAISTGELQDFSTKAKTPDFEIKDSKEVKGIVVVQNYDNKQKPTQNPLIAANNHPDKKNDDPKKDDKKDPSKDILPRSDNIPDKGKGDKKEKGDNIDMGDKKEKDHPVKTVSPEIPPPKSNAEKKNPEIVPAPKVLKDNFHEKEVEMPPAPTKSNIHDEEKKAPVIPKFSVKLSDFKPQQNGKHLTIEDMYKLYLKNPENPYEYRGQQEKNTGGSASDTKSHNNKDSGSKSRIDDSASKGSEVANSSATASSTKKPSESIVNSSGSENLGKYELYMPPTGTEYGSIPHGAIMPWQIADHKDLEFETNNSKFFPAVSDPKTKWGTIFYYKKHGEEKIYIPYILKIPSDYTIPKDLPFWTLPVWNQYSGGFKSVSFRVLQSESNPARDARESSSSSSFSKEKAKDVIQEITPLKTLQKESIQPKMQKPAAQNFDLEVQDEFEAGAMFKNCQEGIEMMATNPIPELKLELADRCGVETGDQLQKYVPLLGDVQNKIGNVLGVFSNTRLLAQTKSRAVNTDITS